MSAARILSVSLLACLAIAQTPPRREHTWRDPSPHAARFAGVSGVRLHYLDWGGRGAPVVFLPGLGQSAHIFDGLAPRFTRTNRVLALTQRGHGSSARPENGYDTGTLAVDLLHFLNALNIRTVVLAGHSMSGNVLTEFARQHPERVAKLIYIEAAYDFTLMPSGDPVRIEQPSAEELKTVAGGMRWFERVFGFASPAIEADARDVNLSPDGTLHMEPAPPEISAQLWRGMVSYRPGYETIRAPILAIYAISASHPLLPPNADAATREQANTFWQTKWRPYQKQSVAQLLESGGRVDIRILRNAQHLCFIRPEDERRVVDAMAAFLMQ
jgi:pimeloyl-ACP methyl ester carboxylesterase